MHDDILKFIESNRALLDLVTDLVPIPLFIKDRQGRYVDCNKAFETFLSFSRAQIIGKTVYDIWSKDEADVFFAKDEALLSHGGLQIYESKITSSNGVANIVQFHKQAFTDPSGAVVGFLGVIFDITEKKTLERALSELAATDELTGLPNRREGMIRLEMLHRESDRKNRPYCLAMLDLDHFKKLNDLYGHANGDRVLKSFAQVIRRELRSGDVCFRYGGEEFVLMLPETRKEEGWAVAERLRQSWAENAIELPDGRVLGSTVSIGISGYPAGSVSFEDRLQASDRALYRAKNGGRNRSVCE